MTPAAGVHTHREGLCQPEVAPAPPHSARIEGGAGEKLHPALWMRDLGAHLPLLRTLCIWGELIYGKGRWGLHSHPALLGGGKCVSSPVLSLPPETAPGAVTNGLGEGGSGAPGGSGDSQEAQQGLKAA